MDKWDRGIKNLNQRLNNLVRPFTIAGTVGAASLGLIGKAGLDTEKALLRLRAELGLTEDQMRALREEALRVGSDLPLNTADIVNAQRAYGKLGATFAEIIRDAPAIAGAAVATDLQPEQVARYARIVQNVFGGDPQENLDIMVRLATRSQGDFLAFGEALQFSGQAAADAGLDFKTYISVLGGLAGSGRSVESVSQGLQAIWAKLAKAEEGIGEGGAVVQKAFEGVGISMTDVNATMDGTADSFVRLLELINNAGLSPTQRTALLSTLADVTYASAVSSAVQNTEKIRDLLAEAALAPGEISRQQETVLSGASGGITIMMAQIDTLLNRLAEFGTLTGLQQFSNGISGLIGWLTKMDEEGELVNRRVLQLISIGITALASLLAVAAALKVTTFALSGFVVLLKIARGAVWLWRNAIIMTRIQLGLLALQTWWANSALGRFIASLTLARIAQLAGAAATGVAAAATWAFNAALWANPVGLIVLGIVALIAALVLLVRHWDTVTDALRWAWDWIKSNWPLLAPILLGPFGIVIAAVWKFRDEIIGAFVAIKDGIIEAWRAAVDFVLDQFGRIKDIPGVGAALDALGVVVPGFAQGGVVPGPLGKPVLSLVHGGEMVLPPAVGQMLRGFAAGPAALPTAPPGAAQMLTSSSVVDNRTVNVEVGPITIHTQATDGREIGQQVGQVIEDHIRNIAFDQDGPIAR